MQRTRRRVRATTTVCTLVCTALVALSPGAQAAAGDLDPAFGTGGKVTTDFAGGTGVVFATVLEPDGKIVAVGNARVGGNDDVALARYNPDGTLDTTFGTNGKVTTDFGGNEDSIRALVRQPDGKLVAAGVTALRAMFDFAVVRYRPDGTLDTSFGSGGKVITDFAGGIDSAFAAALQPDGKLVAAGEATVNGTSDFALARYDLRAHQRSQSGR